MVTLGLFLSHGLKRLLYYFHATRTLLAFRRIKGNVEASICLKVSCKSLALFQGNDFSIFFVGFCTNFSTDMFSLNKLLKAKVKFHWSFECQQAFDNVKSLLCFCPVLATPCFDHAFMLQVGANHGSRFYHYY